MRKARTWAACLGVLVFVTLTISSARADSFSAVDLVTLNNSEGHHLNFRDEVRSAVPSLFAEFFEGNNGLHLGLLKNNAQDLVFENSSGKHLGFSVATANRGNRTGLFRGPTSSGGGSGEGGGSTIPNPEPTAVLLLGSGLVAAGAYARRRFRKPGR
ncbi:MAG TPA: PEP-CTERM sorting domain-containing protein [Pyrinomonadaceae bacterium]|nr:PEP-CTERM sorting domain-containing protein [Pyrinomonadaceae bacterium]